MNRQRSLLLPSFVPLLLALVTGVFSVTASATVQEITAVFRPDPSNPSFNKFVNTTPESGICPGHIPTICKALGIFSIRVPFVVRSNGPILANHTDPRQGMMYKVPSDFRDVQVTHSATGATEIVQMRIAGVGGAWGLPRPPGVSAWAGPSGESWASRWRTAPSPCTSTNYIAAGNSFALFFWIVPENAGVCSRAPTMDISSFWHSLLEFAYELRTPNPLKMKTGQYTGTITFRVGPNGDFDFGDVMIPDDELFTFNFTLNVEHVLKVELPPGGDRVELEPLGGWQQWLQSGRKPTRLFRDQTFLIAASSRFKMRLECRYSDANTCALWEPSVGHSVPVNISVSLPYGIVDGRGQAVNRLPLLRDGSGTELFEPSLYVDRKPGTLHFEIPPDEVDEMLKGFSARHYSGQVTVIWDSEV